MKTEFTLAFNEVIQDKQLPKEVIMEAIEAAMVSAYRRAVNASTAQRIEAKIDPETGEVSIFAEKEVVDHVQDDRTEVLLDVARKYEPETEMGELVLVESTPEDFGRVAAQTARQVIQQRIREAEREVQYNHFYEQVGEIISGVVQAITNGNVTVGLDMKAEGLLPYKEQIPRERFRIHERIRALLYDVKMTPRGPQITLSRSHRNFLRRLLENEVPEIYNGFVEIRSIAREPGQRSKVAVSALKPGVDPVGACVGIRGVRIQAIVRELNDEKIDVIEWNPDPTIYINKALSPARVSGVYLNEPAKGTKTATVVVPEDQLSLAIGRDGQNARLAAKLTSWRIDIKSLPEAVSDLLNKLQTDPEYMPFAEREEAVLPQIEEIMAKKAQGRPVTPEEYQVLNQFVDRVERSVLEVRTKARKKAAAEREAVIEVVPDEAFEIPIEEFEISQRINTLLREAGIETIGALMVQMELDSDKILAIQGLGPKSMEEIEAALQDLTFEPAVAEEPIAEEVVEQIPEEAAEETIAEVIEVGVDDTVDRVLAEAAVEAGEIDLAAQILGGEAETADILEAGIDLPVEELEEAVQESEVEFATAEEEVEEEPLIEVDEEEIADRSLDELFEMKPEIFEYEPVSDEEEEDLEYEDRKGKPKRKKKKRKKYVEMEYDPDQDVVIVKKKRKRGEGEWDELDF